MATPRQGKNRITLRNSELKTERQVVVDRDTGRLSKRQARETWTLLCNIVNFPHAGLVGEWPPFQQPPEVSEAPVPIWYRIERRGEPEADKHGMSDLYLVPYTEAQKTETEEREAREAAAPTAPATAPAAAEAVA